MRAVRIEAKDLNKIIINYRITEKCNYKCPYCYFKGRNPINLQSDYTSIRNVFYNLKYIIDYYRQQGYKIEFFLTGGEPSIYPIELYERFFDIIDQRIIDKLTLSTNFSADPQWFIDFSENCRDKTNFEIKAAFHPSETTFDEYYDKIKKIKDAPNRLIAHFTFDDNNFIGMDKINQIKELGVGLDIVLIHTKKNNFGSVNAVNEDLLSLINEQKKVIAKNYVAYYNNGTSSEFTKKEIKKMNFSKHPVKCYNTDITIMQNKIGVNCEYMRAIGKIHPESWKDIGEKILDKTEIIDYLQNECVIICNRQSCNVGSNCSPRLLDFSKENIITKIKNLIHK